MAVMYVDAYVNGYVTYVARRDIMTLCVMSGISSGAEDDACAIVANLTTRWQCVHFTPRFFYY